jgi:hypothetical protein
MHIYAYESYDTYIYLFSTLYSWIDLRAALASSRHMQMADLIYVF